MYEKGRLIMIQPLNRKILVVAAHPDDEILGCGGTIARLVDEGDVTAYTLVLGEGITSRDKIRQRTKREKDIVQLKKQGTKANKAIGINKVFTADFPDNRFDSVPFLDIVKTIEKVKAKLKPQIVFTHFEKDLNIDHQITYKAVITATRPMQNETVREIYSFEIPSSTEWYFPGRFSPDIFFDITSSIEKKSAALLEYKTEMREYPHPRSLEGVKITANKWGLTIGCRFAEAFKVVRIVR